MYTLRIEHAITDFAVWSGAFARFDGPRQQAGVRAHRVLQPPDDRRFVSIDLDFDSPEAASAFLTFLTENVWSSKENSPGLAGIPRTSILVLAASG